MSKQRYEYIYNDVAERYEVFDCYVNLSLSKKGLITTLNEQNNKISDLEAKLAESKNDYLLLEEQLENANEWSKYFQEENEQLKQQLAEKEKEINERMMVFEKRCQEYYKSKEFTIEQLEKVKGKIQHNILFVNRDDYLNVIEEIDNQIKELKEMK